MRKIAVLAVLFWVWGIVPVTAVETQASVPLRDDLSADPGGEAANPEPAAPGDDQPANPTETAEDDAPAEDEADDEQAPAISVNPASFTYPTLAHRDLGQPVVDVAGSKKTWPHKLPVWGQKVLDLGIDFPNPYGVSVIGTYLSQQLEINNLKVSFDDGQTYDPFDWVQFPGSRNSTYSVETKIDAWLFPFMNVFAIAGYVNGSGSVPVGLPVEPLLDTLGHGHLCPDSGPLRPGFCDDIVMLDALPEYYGYNAGVGTVLAMGWKGFYVAVPMSYIYSDMSNLEYSVGALTVETLIGHTFKMGGGRLFEVFIGGNYLNTTNTIVNTFTLPLSEVDGTVDDVVIHYEIDETNTDKWNYVVGGQFQFNKSWNIQCQIGFGGTRDQYTLSGVYRW
jgi:hypothetical protein